MKPKQWITIKLSVDEMHALELYCFQKQRTKTSVLRELIRNLSTYQNCVSVPKQKKTRTKNKLEISDTPVVDPKSTLRALFYDESYSSL